MKKLLLCSLAVLILASTGQTTQTDNRGIHAVPVPGPIIIDGKLDDWDLSGQVLMCYDLETLKDIYSAKVAAMYDADFLYLSVHWTDPNPMSNSHDPHYTAGRAWAGDSVQFRIKTDKISHVLCWYYGVTGEPGIYIDYGKDLKTPFHGGSTQLFQTEGWKMTEGAEMAFRKDDDGKGYVQEIKIPWKVITDGKKYGPGDKFSMGVELLWGAADWPVHRYADNLSAGTSGREFFFTNIPAWGDLILEPHGHLKLPTPAWETAMKQQEPQGPAEIHYDLPEDGRVTLAIDDAAGKRIRNLTGALPRLKGPNTEHWDGLDDDGKVVTPGDYTFKALYHQGIHTNFVFSFANPSAHNGFYADHSAAHAAAAAGDYVALACPIGEAGHPIVGLDINGKTLWGGGRPLSDAGRASLATDGKILWIALDRLGTIYRVEAATGKFAPWNKMDKDPEGHDFKVLDLPIFDASTLPKERTYTPNMRSITVNDTTLAVPLQNQGVIKLLDKETGDAKGEIKIEDPEAAVFDKDGSLIVLSKGKLVRATADGKITPFSEGSFPDGYGLAIDSKRNVYLSVRRADQNVKVLSPEGKLVSEIGLKGGRPLEGEYVAEGMRNPAAIAIDGQDRLWVTEETHNPKRTSLWSVTDGKLLHDFAGTTSYAGAGALDPFDPTIGFSDDTVYKLDWANGTSRPLWSLGLPTGPEDLFPASVYKITNRVIRHGNDEYVYLGLGPTGVCTIHRDGKWRSSAAVGLVPKIGTRGCPWAASPLFAGKEGQFFTWADKNGDGLVQADELTFASPLYNGKPVTVWTPYWAALPDGDGALSFESPQHVVVKFVITGYTPAGAPIYDIQNPKILPVDGPLNGGENMVYGGAEGRVYINQNPLTAIDKTGKTIFTYPNNYLSVHGSHNATAARPGLLIGPSSILGVADMGGETGEVFYLNGNLGENFLFTWDGLYIQSLFKDTRGGFDAPQNILGESFDTTTAGGESFGGNFVRTPDGKTYTIHGGTEADVIEVTGLDKIKRFGGKFTYTPDQYAKAQEMNSTAALAKIVPKVVTAEKAAAPVTVDGKPAAWPELLDLTAPLADIQENEQLRYGRVAARYDDQNLYLAYRVMDHGSKIKNGGQDYRFLFKTGDAVDLMLGPEPQNKDGSGNLRLLFSDLGGKETAVLYQKTVPGTPEKERVAFSSPWMTIYFDRVTQPSEVKVATAPIQGGYFVEAAIPWTVLGVKPSPGLKLKADFGILGADSAGAVTVSRQYWSNKSTGLVNDVPGEADLTPKLWGTLILK